MCLLIVSTNKFPAQELLKLGNDQNPDGAGIAWVEKGKVRWKKGIELPELLTYKDIVKGPHLIHFRLSTVGGKRPSLCHPFAINEAASTELEGEATTVLAHNGHWSGFSREVLLTLDDNIVLPAGPWSDTRAMAWMAHIKGIKFLGSINEKVAVLDTSEDPNGKITMFNKHQFVTGPNKDILLSYDPYSRIVRNGKTTSLIKTGKWENNKPTYNDWEEEGCDTVCRPYKSSSLTGGIANYTQKKYDGFCLPLPIDQ